MHLLLILTLLEITLLMCSFGVFHYVIFITRMQPTKLAIVIFGGTEGIRLVLLIRYYWVANCQLSEQGEP